MDGMNYEDCVFHTGDIVKERKYNNFYKVVGIEIDEDFYDFPIKKYIMKDLKDNQNISVYEMDINNYVLWEESY